VLYLRLESSRKAETVANRSRDQVMDEEGSDTRQESMRGKGQREGVDALESEGRSVEVLMREMVRKTWQPFEAVFLYFWQTIHTLTFWVSRYLQQ